MKLKERFSRWWIFKVRNTKVREGRTEAFRWCFRRFSMDISTASGNFKASWTAGENPYAYLLAGETDENIIGFCQIMYQVGMLLTTEQKFAKDVAKAIENYANRLSKEAAKGVVEDETEEKIALEEVKQVQELVEMPKKERRKYERDVNGRFVKAVKKVENESKASKEAE